MSLRRGASKEGIPSGRPRRGEQLGRAIKIIGAWEQEGTRKTEELFIQSYKGSLLVRIPPQKQRLNNRKSINSLQRSMRSSKCEHQCPQGRAKTEKMRDRSSANQLRETGLRCLQHRRLKTCEEPSDFQSGNRTEGFSHKTTLKGHTVASTATNTES